MTKTLHGQNANLDNIDVTKFAMSIIIVAIHSDLGGVWKESFIYPWARMAVPIFFIISSYLFFRKYSCADKQMRKQRLKRFIVRNLQLYAFWAVALSIPTILIRKYFDEGILLGLLKIIRGFLFGSTFVASWYIMATLLAVCIIALFMKRLSNGAMLALFTCCYVFACLSCNYGNLFIDNELITHAAKLTFGVFGVPYNNFVVALFWVLIGKMIAENETRIINAYKSERHKTVIWITLALGSVLLYCEQTLIRTFDLAYTNDCFFMLPIPVIALFLILLNTKMSTKNAKRFRAASTITYCVHGTFLRLLVFVLNKLGFFDYGVLEFFLALGVSWLITFAILKLETKPSLSWLRLSH